MIAALFVERGGVYYGFKEIDPWDEARDARTYVGPWSVIAHPPCQLWTNFAALNFRRWGGERNRPGNDGGAFESALRNVRRFGGVVEHPAMSKAWAHFGLTCPQDGWTRSGGGFVCEVWQSAYGHLARKRTWLYYCGRTPHALNWARAPGTSQIGWFDRVKPTLGKKEASRTPILFALELILLARNA